MLYIYIYIYIYCVIQKDGLNCVSLYFKIRTSDKYDMAWTVNCASTRSRELVAVFQVLCLLYGLTFAWAMLKTLFNSYHVLLWYTRSSGAFAFTQTSYLLKLVIPTTNVLPRWRLNVQTKTKRTVHCSRRLNFNELTNAKNLVLHSSHFALNWRCCTAVR